MPQNTPCHLNQVGGMQDLQLLSSAVSLNPDKLTANFTVSRMYYLTVVRGLLNHNNLQERDWLFGRLGIMQPCYHGQRAVSIPLVTNPW